MAGVQGEVGLELVEHAVTCAGDPHPLLQRREQRRCSPPHGARQRQGDDLPQRLRHANRPGTGKPVRLRVARLGQQHKDGAYQRACRHRRHTRCGIGAGEKQEHL